MSRTKDEELALKFIGVIFLFMLGILATLFNTYVFTCLWDWFIVSTFSVVSIPFWNAWGIFSLIAFVTAKRPTGEDKDDSLTTTYKSVLAGWIIYPFVAWGIGYIVYTFGVM